MKKRNLVYYRGMCVATGYGLDQEVATWTHIFLRVRSTPSFGHISGRTVATGGSIWGQTRLVADSWDSWD